MTCNIIPFASRLIQKCFRRKCLDLFAYVSSLNIYYSVDSFWFLCCIMPFESSGRFYGPPGITCSVLLIVLWCVDCSSSLTLYGWIPRLNRMHQRFGCDWKNFEYRFLIFRFELRLLLLGKSDDLYSFDISILIFKRQLKTVSFQKAYLYCA